MHNYIHTYMHTIIHTYQPTLLPTHIHKHSTSTCPWQWLGLQTRIKSQREIGGGGGGGRRGGGSRSGGCGDDRTDVGEQYAEFSKVCSLLKSVPQITIELTFEKFLRQMTICHTCTHMHTHTLSLSHTHTHTHTRTPTHPHSPYATS